MQGVLRVLEIYGAALLAEEMEQVDRRTCIATAAERKNQAESLDALMRAMVQLPSYLERVLAGGRDLALVLLPLLNDLRAVRGSALLSEGTLLLLNLQVRQAGAAGRLGTRRAAAHRRTVGAPAARAVPGRPDRLDPRRARRAEPRDRSPPSRRRWSRSPRASRVFQLWWVVGAVIEALRENGLEERRLDQAAAGSCGPRDQAALRSGRGAVRADTRRSSC